MKNGEAFHGTKLASPPHVLCRNFVLYPIIGSDLSCPIPAGSAADTRAVGSTVTSNHLWARVSTEGGHSCEEMRCLTGGPHLAHTKVVRRSSDLGILLPAKVPPVTPPHTTARIYDARSF
jgi:hypothetical protein